MKCLLTIGQEFLEYLKPQISYQFPPKKTLVHLLHVHSHTRIRASCAVLCAYIRMLY